MILSKPLFNALGFYFNQIYNHPVRTKSISCCIIAASGNYASQCIAGNKVLNVQSLLAYALFGLLFGGSIPHYFHSFLGAAISEEASLAILKRLFIERLIYTPLFQAFSLYMLARFEGKDHKRAMGQLLTLYWPVLSSNLKYLTIVQVINFAVIPPMLRVLFMNIVGFFWVLYIANKRRQQQTRAGKK